MGVIAPAQGLSALQFLLSDGSGKNFRHQVDAKLNPSNCPNHCQQGLSKNYLRLLTASNVERELDELTFVDENANCLCIEISRIASDLTNIQDIRMLAIPFDT